MALKKASMKGPGSPESTNDALLLSTLDDLASWTTECQSTDVASSVSIASPTSNSGFNWGGTRESMENSVDELFATEDVKSLVCEKKQVSPPVSVETSSKHYGSPPVPGGSTNSGLLPQSNTGCDQGLRVAQRKTNTKTSKKQESRCSAKGKREDPKFEAWWDETVKSLFSPDLLREGVLRVVEALSKLIHEKKSGGKPSNAAEIEELRQAQAQLDVYREFVESLTEGPSNASGENTEQWFIEKVEALTCRLESLGVSAFPNMLESLFAQERNAIVQALESDSLIEILETATGHKSCQKETNACSTRGVERSIDPRRCHEISHPVASSNISPPDKQESTSENDAEPSDVETELLAELLPRIISEAFPPSMIHQLEQLGNNVELQRVKKTDLASTATQNGAEPGHSSDDDDDADDSVNDDEDNLITREELQSLQAVEHWLGKVLQDHGSKIDKQPK